MQEQDPIKDSVINTIKEKSQLKQVVYDHTKSAFEIIKDVLNAIVNEYNQELKDIDPRVMLEYRDRGEFDVEIKIAGDVIIFNMHSNIFEFPRNHEIWKDTNYVMQPLTTYSGIINIYNFLSDSLKYNRVDDQGYLVGRIFINKENSFFIEGRRELGFNFPAFSKDFVNEKNFKTLIESLLVYILKFDLLVPPYNDVKIISVDYMNNKIMKHQMQTGKRLGFQYNAIKTIPNPCDKKA